MMIDCSVMEELIEKMPPMGISIADLIQAFRSEEPEELSQIALKDPVIAGRLLSAANSAVMRRARKEILSTEDAIRVIGTNCSRSIITMSATADTFNTRLCPAFDRQRYWCSSIETGMLAEEVALHIGHPCDGVKAGALMAGLVGNVGILFMAHNFPVEVNKSLLRHQNMNDADKGHDTLRWIIKNQTQVDYSDVSSSILQQWGLPEPIALAPQGFIQDGAAPSSSSLTSLIKIARDWRKDHLSDDSSALNALSPRDKAVLAKQSPVIQKKISRSIKALQ